MKQSFQNSAWETLADDLIYEIFIDTPSKNKRSSYRMRIDYQTRQLTFSFNRCLLSTPESISHCPLSRYPQSYAYLIVVPFRNALWLLHLNNKYKLF
ncbi:hypothetical protein CEXT_77891 [Caerostris extrusa]|uniref:Uncharacterized protein n=1 Tax=Caerostris extrusa TaxID=172846 RepID=A0AAV4Y3U6_CAEEX|nr:hypothetical protein CEXT_77891 [Caerostris extrusa]